MHRQRKVTLAAHQQEVLVIEHLDELLKVLDAQVQLLRDSVQFLLDSPG